MKVAAGYNETKDAIQGATNFERAPMFNNNIHFHKNVDTILSIRPFVHTSITSKLRQHPEMNANTAQNGIQSGSMEAGKTVGSPSTDATFFTLGSLATARTPLGTPLAWPSRWLPFSILVPEITDAIFQLQLWELRDAAATALGDPGPTLVSFLRAEEGDEVPRESCCYHPSLRPSCRYSSRVHQLNQLCTILCTSYRTGRYYLPAYYYTLLPNISSLGTGRMMMMALAGNAPLLPPAPVLLTVASIPVGRKCWTLGIA